MMADKDSNASENYYRGLDTKTPTKKRKSRKPKENADHEPKQQTSYDGLRSLPFPPTQEPDYYSQNSYVPYNTSNNNGMKKSKYITPPEVPSLPLPAPPSLIRNVPPQLVSSFSIKSPGTSSPRYPTYQTPSSVYDTSYILPPRHMNAYPYEYNPTQPDRVLPSPSWIGRPSSPTNPPSPPPSTEELTRRLYPIPSYSSPNYVNQSYRLQDMSLPHQIDSTQYYSMGNPSYLAEPYYYDMMRYGAVNFPSTSEVSAPPASATPPIIEHEPRNPVPTLNRFGLLQQPHEVQRKSYKSENRCLLPNPLVVSAVVFSQPMPRILGGTVTVKLVAQSGADLPSDKERLLDSLSGTLAESLDESLCANFSLKLLETSEGNFWRLRFHIRYVAESIGEVEEEFLSRPFVVYSNRRKNATALAVSEATT